MLCNENVDCKYFTWIDEIYNDGIGIRKRCHLKNGNANGISDMVGLISGAKGCRQAATQSGNMGQSDYLGQSSLLGQSDNLG